MTSSNWFRKIRWPKPEVWLAQIQRCPHGVSRRTSTLDLGVLAYQQRFRPTQQVRGRGRVTLCLLAARLVELEGDPAGADRHVVNHVE